MSWSIRAKNCRGTLNIVGTDVQIIFIHKGGVILGDLDFYNDMCDELCSKTGLSATFIDYGPSPEYKGPC